ncbi:hypothetical protein ABZZ79_38300 [Streptomyces sp. NPDC006458]|uniref:hypothetical protein n=1 Tax=Streptomyces sp. NPDC006458 TaxID=3154302 RepID=UPI0033B59069
MTNKAEIKYDAPVSVVLTLKDSSAASEFVKKVQNTITDSADSVVLSVRGSQAMVSDILSDLGGSNGDVSAQISLKGDRSAKR